MRLLSRTLSFEEDLHSFKEEVTEEISSEEKLLKRCQEPVSSSNFFHLISCVLMVLMGALILPAKFNFLYLDDRWNPALFLQLADLLCSHHKGRAYGRKMRISHPRSTKSAAGTSSSVVEGKETGHRDGTDRVSRRDPSRRLKFHAHPGNAADLCCILWFFHPFPLRRNCYLIIVQISLILLFYVMMLILKPQSQGITKIGRYFRDRIKITMNRVGIYSGPGIDNRRPVPGGEHFGFRRR